MRGEGRVAHRDGAGSAGGDRGSVGARYAGPQAGGHSVGL